MSGCDRLGSGALELYFYGELGPVEQRELVQHLPTCAACRRALEELALIRRALASRPVVAAPPDGDWRAFMSRLDAAVHLEDRARAGRVVSLDAARRVMAPRQRLRFVPYLAAAAVLALVTAPLVFLARNPPREGAVAVTGETAAPRLSVGAVESDQSSRAAFTLMSGQHFERSKLVVLGLANKDARQASEDDWEYERQLASSLLTDTQLYRLAAEEHGMRSLADVMADLELVLLQTSMARTSDPEDLEQIQRLIEKRDLVTKMDVVATRGL